MSGFELFRQWLGARLDTLGMPGLLLADGSREWLVGTREPAARVAGSAHDLFRTITGRRSAPEVRSLDWTGPVDEYLPVIAPYSLPRAAQAPPVSQGMP